MFSRCTQIRASVPWFPTLYTSWVFPRLAFVSWFPALYCAIHKRKLVFLRLGNGPTFSSAMHWFLYFCLRLVLISCFPAPCTSYVFPCLALLTRFCVQFWLLYYVVFVCCDWSDGITMFSVLRHSFVRVFMICFHFQLPRAGTGDSWRTSCAWKSTGNKNDLKDNHAGKTRHVIKSNHKNSRITSKMAAFYNLFSTSL